MIALYLLAAFALPQDTPALPESILPEVVIEAQPRGGLVTLSCLTQPNGSLAECRIVSETPRGAGFGAAALESARAARLSPATVRGAARGARVDFTVRFTLPVPGEDEGVGPSNP